MLTAARLSARQKGRVQIPVRALLYNTFVYDFIMFILGGCVGGVLVYVSCERRMRHMEDNYNWHLQQLSQTNKNMLAQLRAMLASKVEDSQAAGTLHGSKKTRP